MLLPALVRCCQKTQPACNLVWCMFKALVHHVRGMLNVIMVIIGRLKSKFRLPSPLRPPVECTQIALWQELAGETGPRSQFSPTLMS